MNRIEFSARIDQELDRLISEDKEEKVAKPSCFLSQEQIDEHYDVHYLGYIKGLEAAKKGLENTEDIRQSMLDISFNYNGALLHELYFKSIGKTDITAGFQDVLEKTFGNMQYFLQQFKDLLMASRGWGILGVDRSNDLILNMIDSHDGYIMIGIQPILAIDMFEHSYYIDFKGDKESYIEAALSDINWEQVSSNLDKYLK